MQILGVEAIIFDMDGTLVDSEGMAAKETAALLAERGLSLSEVELARYHGVTWERIAELLVETFPQLERAGLADALQARFHTSFVASSPPLIAGAHAAVLAAAERYPVAIASSGNRVSVEHLVERLGLGEQIPVRVCAEDVRRSKPDPEAYLEAAARLGREPTRCLVFEDSLAGLGAARAAGAMCVAICHGKSAAQRDEVRPLADLCVDDYTALPVGFFDRVGADATQ